MSPQNEAVESYYTEAPLLGIEINMQEFNQFQTIYTSHNTDLICFAESAAQQNGCDNI